MKPTPPTFAAAIRASTRHVHSRVRLWPHGRDGEAVDVTHLVDSVSASRELSGQLPDEVRLVEGAGTGKLDLALSGEPGTSTAATWSRESDLGPLGDAERLACPITVDIGVTVPARGIGWCRIFTGTTRAVSIDGATAASLTALDARDTARDPLTFPPVADAFAGLRLHWCVAYAAHQAGYDAQPSPARLHPVDLARGYWPLAFWPMCGSHAPFVAGANSHTSTVAEFVEPHQDDDQPQTGGVVTVDGPFQTQPAASAYYTGKRRWRRIAGATETYRPEGVDNPPPATNLRLECWVIDDPATARRAPGDLARLAVAGDGGAAVVLTKRGRLVLECARPGRRRPARFVAPPLDSLGWRLEDWNHVGVHVSIDGSGWPVIVWRVNGATAVVSYPMPVSLGRAARAEIGSWLPIFGAAVSRAPAEAPWLDGTDWTATAIVTGADTELMWPGEFESKPAWEHLGDIADAVGAAAHFDTGGRLVFVGPPAQPGEPVAEVTTRAAITSLSIEDSLDRVRNHITVPEQRGSVKPPTSGEPLWSDDEPVKIASGDTVELVAEFSESCVKTDSELTVTGAPEPGQSWAYADYRKEPTPEGARPVPSRLVDARLADVTATGATVAIANKSRSPVWLTTPPGDDRIPAIGVCGWHVKPTTKKHTARDRESVAAYGAFPFGDTETNWRQHGGAERAARLLADLAHPSTVITGLSIVGDPRLAIGDVIAVRDPDGTKLAGSWAITGIADDHTPEGGYVQSLDVHPAPQPTS